MPFTLAMIGIGLSFWAQITHEEGGAGSGGPPPPPPTVALKADLSDANANEAWVFW